MATKKSAAATKPAAKGKAAPSDRTDKLIEKIKDARDRKGQKWDQIAESVGLPLGKTFLLYEMGSVPRGERITGTDAEVGKAIVKAREVDLLSWARIMARTGMGLQACKTAYNKYAKDPAKGARIGKGGRHPGSGAATPIAKGKAIKEAKAAKASKAGKVEKTKPAKKSAAAAKTAVKRPRKRIAANPAVGAEDDSF